MKHGADDETAGNGAEYVVGEKIVRIFAATGETDYRHTACGDAVGKIAVLRNGQARIDADSKVHVAVISRCLAGKTEIGRLDQKDRSRHRGTVGRQPITVELGPKVLWRRHDHGRLALLVREFMETGPEKFTRAGRRRIVGCTCRSVNMRGSRSDAGLGAFNPISQESG